MSNPALKVDIGADISNLRAEMQKAQGLVSGLTSNLGKVAATVGVAFGVREVAAFTVEVSRLAGEAVGVKNAFDRLQDSQKVLQELKAATQNTVSELDLMKAAVQANNFDIPITQLAKLFEFANQRAVATGQSVDYLVESIILGIGRKSPLILDNLGISAIQLRERLKGVGTEAATVADVAKVVGDIADEALKKSGKTAENAATNMQQLSASWENLKVSVGELVNNAGLPKVIQFLKEAVDLFNILAGKRNPFSKAQIQDFIDAWNKGGRSFEDQVVLLKMIEEAAQRSGIQLIRLKENANDLGKLFIKPQPVNFVNGMAEDAKKATVDLEALKKKAQEAAKEARELLEIQMMWSTQSATRTPLQGLGGQLKPISPQLKPISPMGKISPIEAPDLAIEQTSRYTATLTDLKQVAIDTGTILQDLATNGFMALGEAIGSSLSGVGNFGDTILRSIAGFGKQVGQILIAAGTAALAAKKFIVTNPVAAIAAGVALVAISSAVMGSIGNAAANMGGGGGGGGAANPRAIDNYLRDRQEINATSWDGMQLQITGLVGNNFTAAMRKSSYSTSFTGG